VEKSSVCGIEEKGGKESRLRICGVRTCRGGGGGRVNEDTWRAERLSHNLSQGLRDMGFRMEK
jgi:hypothetical protein